MFCCWGRQGCDCDNEDEIFYMGGVRIVTSIPLDATHEQTTSTTSISTEEETTTSSDDTLTTPTTTTRSPAETTRTNAPNSDSSTDGGDSSGSSTGIALGVGLGVGIPLILIAVGLAWFFLRKRAAAARAELEVTEIINKTSTDPSTQSPHSFLGYFNPKRHSPAATTTYAEMQGTDYRHEMDTAQVSSPHSRWELPE